MRTACLCLWILAGYLVSPAETESVETRRDAALRELAERGIDWNQKQTWVDSQRWSTAHACLAQNVRLDEANRYFSEVEFASLMHGLVRDTDVQVTDLLRTYFEFRGGDRLSPAAQAHLRELFAAWAVPNHDRNRDADTRYEWPHEYTENHSLNILVASVLIDQVLDRPRERHAALLKQFLDDRARWGWNEFNSTRYGLVTAKALSLPADFAVDAHLRDTARMHLDLLAIDYATQCLGTWLGRPSSRGAGNRRSNRNNAMRPLAQLWFGTEGEALKADGFMVHFLTSTHRPPAVALALQNDPARRGAFEATQVATTGAGRERVPIVSWVSPHVTMASAQGVGSYYDGVYAVISFASSPDPVVTCAYGGGRNLFQLRNVMMAFGDVEWHGGLQPQAADGVGIAHVGKAWVGQVGLGEDAHLLMVSDEEEHADAAEFGKALATLDAGFRDGVVSWRMPDGDEVRVENRRAGDGWELMRATVNGERVRLDRNFLFDSPFMHSVRGSGRITVRHGAKQWLYDFRDPAGPVVREEAVSGDFDSPAERVDGPLGMAMVLVPAGEFALGSPLTEGRSDERPQRWVTVDPFYISRTEITLGQYRAYLEQAPGAPALPEWYPEEWARDETMPVAWVSWEEADAFCRWLTTRTGERFRLPTEAEWEKAAKGYGHHRYPWGDSYDGTQAGSPNMTYLPVGSKPRDESVFGVLDMAGNVWEWCSDWYDSTAYATAAGRNPRGPDTGEYRVLRGCGWNYDPDTFRCGFRSRFEPAGRSLHIGFRVVRELTAAPARTDLRPPGS